MDHVLDIDMVSLPLSRANEQLDTRDDGQRNRRIINNWLTDPSDNRK